MAYQADSWYRGDTGPLLNQGRNPYSFPNSWGTGLLLNGNAPSAPSATVAGPYGSGSLGSYAPTLGTGSPGAVAAPGGATSSTSTNPFTTLRNTKSEPIAGYQDKQLGDYGAIQGSNAIDQYINQFNAAEPGVQSRYGQEQGVLNDIYSGANLARQQRDVAARTGAVGNVMDLIGKQIAGRTNAQNAIRGGGLGGWQNRFMAGEAEKQFVPLALQNADISRQYSDMNDAQKLALIGRTASMVDSNTRRALVPLQTRQQNLGANIPLLSGINALDKSNMFYGVQSPYDAMSPSYQVPGYGGNVAPRGGGYGGGYGQPNTLPVPGGGRGGYGGSPTVARVNGISSQGWNNLFSGTDMTGLTPNGGGGYSLPNNYAGYDNPMSPLYTPGWDAANQYALSQYYEGNPGYIAGE